jgi:DNA-binding MarR family transcriptional regulator
MQAEKKALQSLLWALKPLSNLRGSIPLPFATVFLMIALDEGHGVNSYARAMGIHRSAMSRYLRDIGARARNGGPGLGLVTVKPHGGDQRRYEVLLTPKGRSIIKQIVRHIRRSQTMQAGSPTHPAASESTP